VALTIAAKAASVTQAIARSQANPLKAGRFLLDLLYPPSCAACDRPVAEPDGLCPSCFSQLVPISAPLCPRLGLPFAISLGPKALSAEAIADPPPFDRARAAVVYTAVAQALVAKLKYSDRPELARLCGRLMAGAGREFWHDRPVLVPVPLHPVRQLQRRYNQSLELARVLGRLCDLPVMPDLVMRVKRTRQQVGLSASERLKNVAGAFRAHPRALERLRGRPVVLIDDVMTTGATLKALTRALKHSGADHIDVLVFARVVPGEEIPI
jgi:ComF family protein